LNPIGFKNMQHNFHGNEKRINQGDEFEAAVFRSLNFDENEISEHFKYRRPISNIFNKIVQDTNHLKQRTNIVVRSCDSAGNIETFRLEGTSNNLASDFDIAVAKEAAALAVAVVRESEYKLADRLASEAAKDATEARMLATTLRQECVALEEAESAAEAEGHVIKAQRIRLLLFSRTEDARVADEVAHASEISKDRTREAADASRIRACESAEIAFNESEKAKRSIESIKRRSDISPHISASC